MPFNILLASTFCALRAIASGAVYCNRSCLCVCGGRAGERAGGWAVSEPYYSQRARSVCVSLSAFFIVIVPLKMICYRVHL